MRIILVRHGESENNKNHIIGGNSSLTKEGREQARKLATDLSRHSSISIERIFCGLSLRSNQTADEISNILQKSVHFLSSIKERHHGVLEGRPYSEIKSRAKAYKEVNGKIYVIDVKDGENYQLLYQRAKILLATLQELARDFGVQRDVLVIGHGALNKAINAVHHDLGWENLLQKESLDNCQYYILDCK